MTIDNLDYIDIDEREQQKTVTFEIPNPDNPDSIMVPFGTEPVPEFWEGAKWSVDQLGSQRNPLVGHLMYCLMEIEESDNTEPFLNFCQNILEDTAAGATIPDPKA